MLPDYRQDRWLNTAVSGIRFYVDRNRVRKELEGHLEDKIADLRRIFPDIPEEEARTRALSAMGDPEELKIALARVHRPWLGWLWLASQWAVLALWFLSIAMGFQRGSAALYTSLWGFGGAKFCGAVETGETARVGGYTFRITGAACLDRPEEAGGVDTLQVVLRASAPCPWEKIDEDALLNSLYLTGPDGQRRYMGWVLTQDYTTVDELGNVTERRRQWTSGGGLCRWSLGWTEVAVNIPAEGWQPGDVVTVELDSPAGRAELSVPVTEKVRVT